MPGGGFGIVRAQGKTYVAPAWIEVSADTQISDIEVIGRFESIPIYEPKTVTIMGSAGKKYLVSFDPYGKPSCECVGFTYHRKCKHIQQALAVK
jgi:hypothetical protein